MHVFFSSPEIILWKNFPLYNKGIDYESDLRSNEHYLLSSSEKKARKNSGLYGIWTHDCCEDRFHIHIFNFSSNIRLPYTHNQ